MVQRRLKQAATTWETDVGKWDTWISCGYRCPAATYMDRAEDTEGYWAHFIQKKNFEFYKKFKDHFSRRPVAKE